MIGTVPKYKAVVSSDWSECLSPNGPFDPLSFNYPELSEKLSTIFRQYTGNEISLSQAAGRIKGLLPRSLTEDQMDAYLDRSFSTYLGVPDLIEWCLNRDILFIINTTNTQAYFQRAFKKGLLPEVPVVAANPMIKFPRVPDDRRYVHEILEIEDKPRVTQALISSLNLPPQKVIVMGDSGGDGPHFQWAAASGAYLIGSMIKPSLAAYCRAQGININLLFGVSYAPGERRNIEKEMKVDFMELADVIDTALA
jgi:2-hydroxy-3-keto-5-methylthiopentenyl-1-phosphate phosphatase